MKPKHRVNLLSKSIHKYIHNLPIYFIMQHDTEFYYSICSNIYILFATFIFRSHVIRSLQLQLNHTKSACSKMNRTIAQLRIEVNDKMVKKFGMKIDFDEMEEAVLARLLMNQLKVDDTAKNREKELRKLKVIFTLRYMKLISKCTNWHVIQFIGKIGK